MWRLGIGACALVATLVASIGCHETLDREELEGAEIGSAREKCVVGPPPATSRGGMFSLAFGADAYFVFGETWEGEASSLRIVGSSGATLEAGGDPCSELVDVRDSDGNLEAVIPLTVEEEAENLAATDGRRTAIWPISGFVSGDEGFVYFRKVRVKDFFDVVDVGIGVSRVRLGRIAERAPGLIWQSPERDWGQSAFLSSDGYAYVYGCYQRASFDLVCRVARVEPSRATERDAYRYYEGTDWVAEPERAANVVAGVNVPSVAENAHLGRLFLVHAGFLENRVYGRSAPRPEGEFSEAEPLFVGTAPKSFWVSEVVQHPALATDGGRKLITSYYTDPPDGSAGLRFVEVTLR